MTVGSDWFVLESVVNYGKVGLDRCETIRAKLLLNISTSCVAERPIPSRATAFNLWTITTAHASSKLNEGNNSFPFYQPAQNGAIL